MKIKNYTSGVVASKSMAKIEEMLVEVGARNINKEYENKECVGITFLIDVPELDNNTLPFRLTANTNACYEKLLEMKESETVRRVSESAKQTLRDQSEKTAWKILSDMIEIQCTNILLGQSTVLELFMGKAFDQETGKTFVQKIEDGTLKLLS